MRERVCRVVATRADKREKPNLSAEIGSRLALYLAQLGSSAADVGPLHEDPAYRQADCLCSGVLSWVGEADACSRQGNDRMICFVLCRGYETSVNALQDDPRAPKVTFLYYSEALRKRSLPAGTYIFTCLSTLGAKDRVAAARLYRRLREAGCLVFNDPARVRTRYSLLRALHRTGINPFNAYSVEAEERPRRFPVFVRLSHGSHPPLTDLIWDPERLEQAVEAAVTSGYPRETLMVVEYAGEPVRDGVFRKSSIYRVGDHFVPDIWWYSRSWNVKADHDGLADAELYREELRLIRENGYPKEVERAFELANIDHGRLDFSFVDGRVCIYEINLLPAFYGPRSHPVPERVESLKLRWDKLCAAFHAINSSTNTSLKLVETRGTSIEALKQAHTVFPALRPTLISLSREYERRGNLAAALESAESAVAADPNDVKALARLGRVLQRSNRIDDSIAVAKRVLELSPRGVKERHRLVTLLLQEGRFTEARDQLLEAMAFGVESQETRRLLARANRQLGDKPVARAAPRRAARFAPSKLVRLAWLRGILMPLLENRPRGRGKL
jgi:tetratricopeptide (TPR) repeat protein